MKQVCIIGDPHGHVEEYYKITQFYNKLGIPTISVGDNGFYEHWEWGLLHMDTDMNKWVHGNHDMNIGDYFTCPLSLGHSNYWNDIFTVRGAVSIDKIHRPFGVEWFPEEELSVDQANDAIDLYVGTSPKVVVSHECPSDVKYNLFGFEKNDYTNVVLQEMFELHQPELWIFGHYHRNAVYHYKGTTFICLKELQPMVVNID